MLAAIGGLLLPVLNLVIGPFFAYLNRKQDVGLETRKIDTNARIETHRQDLGAVASSNEVKRGFYASWISQSFQFVITASLAIHFAAIVAVSTFPLFFKGWVVNALPSPFDQWEGTIILSFFVVGQIVGLVRK